jgi:hypothetical protein
MVRFDQNRIVFEDEDNIDQYRVELLNTGELEIEYLPSGDMWKFENDGTLDADSLNVANYNDSAIDHDKTSNRTHDGDDLSPATLEAGTKLSAPTASEGDVVTVPDNPDVVPIYFDAQTGQPLVPNLEETV